MGRTLLPIFAIAEKLIPPGKDAPILEYSIDKFPSLKGLILEQTYRFNNILLVEYLTPIYEAAKAVCTVGKPISELVSQGVITEVRPVASNSETLYIRIDLRSRPSPAAYVPILYDLSITAYPFDCSTMTHFFRCRIIYRSIECIE